MQRQSWLKCGGNKWGGVVNNARCIDLGAAEGLWSIWLLENGAKDVTAVEYRAKNVRKMNYLLNKHYKVLKDKMHIVQEDIMRYEFDGVYDLALSSGLLYHLTSDEQILLMKKLSLHAKHILLGTMIFYPGPLDQQLDADPFGHPIHSITEDGLLVIDVASSGVGAASTTKLALWPTLDRLYEVALEFEFKIEPLIEPEMLQQMNSYRRNARVQDGIRVGYHDYWLTGPLARD